MLPYDASQEALYYPYKRPTVFKGGQQLDVLAMGSELARLAYWPAEIESGYKLSLREALGAIEFDTPTLFGDAKTGTQGFGTHRAKDNTLVLSFRGTEPNRFSDIATDLKFSLDAWQAGGKVHHGFAEAAKGIQGQVDAYLSKFTKLSMVLLTGHSLGAAIATLYASLLAQQTANKDVAIEAVVIGSPRVGDASFAKTLKGVTIHRIVNCCDVITHLPPADSTLISAGYVHVCPATHILSDGSVWTGAEDDNVITGDANRARIDYIAQHAWRWGDVLMRDMADHAPINYVRAFFPSLT
jgi:hypothetical protein